MYCDSIGYFCSFDDEEDKKDDFQLILHVLILH
jgi:hypothetical protein